MRNSSLVKRSRAENVTGLKCSTEAKDVCAIRGACVVEERSCLRRSRTARSGGAAGSENAGMSNHKAGENPAHRKSKVSWATIIVPGLVGPKPRRVA